MRSHAYSLLRTCTIAVVSAAALLTLPSVLGRESGNLAVMEVKNRISAPDIAGRYQVTLLDSIPELNKYLVQGSPANLALLAKDGGVSSIDYRLVAEISERALLNFESTVALLDPEAIALLFDKEKTWDGQHWSKSSLVRQPALQRIQFDPSPLVWDPVTVAVIDTGIDPAHETLAGSTLPGRNFINPNRSTDELEDLDPATRAILLGKSSSAFLSSGVLSPLNASTVVLLDPVVAAAMYRAPTPYFGHGTMVSGLIHAIAPSAKIMPLKVFDSAGYGNSFRIAQAIIYGVNQGASVINMSFSLETRSALVDEAVDYAWRNGVVLVASVGNTNSRVDRTYPAGDHQVIGVAATDLQDQKASFSSWGPASDVAAPGQALISPYPAGLYAIWSGTSASAALVSGEAALLLSRPDLKKDLKAKDVVKRIGERVDHIQGKYDLGKGRINLKEALKK